MLGATAVVANDDLQKVFARYHVGWQTRNPDLIAQLHSDDTVFWVHDGSEPVTGREALRRHCVDLFAKYQFHLEEGRMLFGSDHWILEYKLLMDLVDTKGSPFTARVEMLHVVNVNAAGEVTRKEVYVNGAQMKAAYSRAALETDRDVQH
jgi:SnoaL-like domain